MSDAQPGPSPEDLAACLRALEALRTLPVDHPAREEVARAAAHLRRDAQRARKRARERAGAAADRALFERSRAAAPDARAPVVGALRSQRCCTACKATYDEVAPGHPLHCAACARLFAEARAARVDLRGRRALVTGGRIKIGYEVALRLLRDGAHVSVTTRFPADAAARYAREPDAAEWTDRLRIHRLDLRRVPDVLAFTARFGRDEPALDVLVNNAAQTIRKPDGDLARLCAREAETLASLDAAARALLAGPVATLVTSAELVALASPDLPAATDEHGEPVDLGAVNSWSARVDEVSPLELLEVQVINAVAPYLLVSGLRSLLTRSSFADRYVVNVTAAEGQFERPNKTWRHPHTNMAKAALNMLTRTSAADLVREGVFMVSVDPGWVTDENPHPKRERLRADGFRTPLDVYDGAARVVDPIVRGVRGAPVWGCLLRDLVVAPW